MLLPELQAAISSACKEKDYPRCFTILDGFMTTAQGHDLGEALSLKAGIIALSDQTQIPLGLITIDQALRYLVQPGRRLLAVVNGLALCRTMNDTDRAESYANIGYSLLRNHGDDPEVIIHRPGLYISLGRFAEQQGDMIQAYWHYNQAIIDLQQPSTASYFETSQAIFWAHIHTANVCLKMNRPVEALEAVESASKYVYSEAAHKKWTAIHNTVTAAVFPSEESGATAGNHEYLDELTHKSLLFRLP